MPRSPVVFSLPPGTVPQVPDSVISSAMFNGAMSDIEQTFNTPQPIQYGGTAATTAIGGFDGLNTKGANVATAATLNLDTATGAFVDLTGTTTVTAVTLSDGRHRMARATGAFQITVGASLIGNAGGSNINVEVGDLIIFEGYSAGVVRFWVIRASGNSVKGVVNANRNLWVNPDFSLSQENGNTLGTASGFFPADQIALYFLASTAAMSVQRVQVRSLANSLNQVEFKTTTAKASLGANDFVTLTQPIEGSSFAEAGFGTANAKPYAFRFQITAPAGTYHWHFANSAANRHCSVPFVVAGGEANTAVVKEVVVPADTGGTWLTADGVIGLTAELVLAAGATLTGGTASTWGGTFYLAASANFNTLGSTANVVRLADVGIKKDEAAAGYGAWAAITDAIYRSERYAWFRGTGTTVGTILTTGQVISSTLFQGMAELYCQMPAPITVTSTSALTFGVYQQGTIAVATGTPTIGTISSERKSLSLNVTSGGMTLGAAASLINTSGNIARVGFFARLT